MTTAIQEFDKLLKLHKQRIQPILDERAAEQAWKASEREAAERRHVELCHSWISWHQEQKAKAEQTCAVLVAKHDAEIQRYRDLLSKTHELEAPRSGLGVEIL